MVIHVWVNLTGFVIVFSTALEQPQSLACKLELASDQEIPADWFPFVTVECEVADAVASHTRVKSVGIESDVQPQKHLSSRAYYHCQVQKPYTSHAAWHFIVGTASALSLLAKIFNHLLCVLKVEIEKKLIEAEVVKQSSCATQ